MSNHSYKLLAGIVLGICSQAGFAATTNNDLSNSTWVLTMSSGPAWESAGDTQTINLTPDIQRTYAANQSTYTILNNEVFFGRQILLSHSLLGQMGVAAVATSGAVMSGNIWEDGDPAFDNYTYNYKLSHRALLVEGKLVGNWNWPVMPWISVGVGAGFNRSANFSNIPTINEAVASPNFTDNTTTAFTYTVAIGAQHQFDQHWAAGLSHEFSDWGRSELGQAPGQTQESGLSLKHLHTNSMLLNVTYSA